MVLWFWLACASSTGSVNPGDSAGSASSENVSLAGSCELQLAAQTPVGQGVAIDSEISVRFSEPVMDATLLVEGATGHSVLSSDGMVIRFVADAPLQFDHHYEVIVNGCGSERNWSFDTVEAPVNEKLAGRSYGIELLSKEVQWNDPVGQVVSPLLAAHDLLLTVVSDGPRLGLVIMPSDGTEAYRCAEPIRFAPVDFAGNPWFWTEEADGKLPLPEGELPVYSLKLDGCFLPDASGIENLHLTGLVDTREFVRQDGMSICKVSNCVECPGSNSKTCVNLDLVVPQVEWWPAARDDGSYEDSCP